MASYAWFVAMWQRGFITGLSPVKDAKGFGAAPNNDASFMAILKQPDSIVSCGMSSGICVMKDMIYQIRKDGPNSLPLLWF
ncbi:unnamed protein product, partial [Mesorhabditis belari]|uniref:Uncharacterized protein n=1 Tax=Mesorhabditis belari TaxID=2138241 RepID=A0AAF3EC40_9BILA